MSNDISRRAFLGVAAAAGASIATNSLAQDNPIPVALVGCGHIHTGSYAGILKNHKDVVVRYVWDIDPKRAKAYADNLGAKIATSPEQVWSDKEIKGVVITPETNQHRGLVIPAAKAGKHMFVEKPMGISGRESREMVDAIEKAKVLFTTGYFMRTSGQLRFLRDQIKAGAFGKITRARASNTHSGSLGGWFDGDFRWMADPKIAGVGGFGDLGTHVLDILMWFFGDVEKATADIQVVTGRYGKCDEMGEGLIHFKSGVVATLAAGWVDCANPVTLEIDGTEGHAVIFNGQLYFRSDKVKGSSDDKPWTELPDGLPAPLEQWIAAITGKADQPLVTAREAGARVGVMEAMYRGSVDGKWVAPL